MPKVNSTSLRIVREYFPDVRKVNDADDNAIVEVTKADNKNSKVRNHTVCAMAVACKRTFKLDGVIVAVKTAYLIRGNVATRYHLPESVSREIVSVDRNAGFDEGTYQLSKVSKSRRIGAPERGNKRTKDRHSGTKGETPFKHMTHGIRAALGSKVAPDGITLLQA